jgi:hypothetical protein
MAGVSIEMATTQEADRIINALAVVKKQWNAETQARFVSEWRAMEKSGAQLQDVEFVDGRVLVGFGDDFKRHIAAYGVTQW